MGGCRGAREKRLAAIGRGLSGNRLVAMSLLFSAFPAHATSPPPPAPPVLREARMHVVVQLIEASNGKVNKITELCQLSGKIPVYADDGSAAYANEREIAGCTMPRNGRKLSVSVRGAKAVSKDSRTYATASVSVTPPDAVPLCSQCGPQPLADSSAEVRVSGKPKSMKFSLNPNPVSMLNAKPTVWLEAEVEIVD